MKPEQHCSCNTRQESLENSTPRTLPSIGNRVVRTSHFRAPAFRRPVQGVTLENGIGGMMCSNPRVKRRRAKQAKTRQPCRPIPCRAANLGLFLDQRLTEELVPRERPLVTFASRFLRTVRGQVPVLCRASRPGAISEHDDSHRQFLVGHPSMEELGRCYRYSDISFSH